MSQSDAAAPSAITPEQFLKLLDDTMPDTRALDLRIERLVRGEVTVVLAHHDDRLRPGGTISGPALFNLADLALYAVTLSIVGMEPLAVTTDVTIHFLRKPPPAALRCEGRVLKAGRRLVIAEATLYSEGVEGPVAHVVGSYSVPPTKSASSEA